MHLVAGEASIETGTASSSTWKLLEGISDQNPSSGSPFGTDRLKTPLERKGLTSTPAAPRHPARRIISPQPTRFAWSVPALFFEALSNDAARSCRYELAMNCCVSRHSSKPPVQFVIHQRRFRTTEDDHIHGCIRRCYPTELNMRRTMLLPVGSATLSVLPLTGLQNTAQAHEYRYYEYRHQPTRHEHADHDDCYHRWCSHDRDQDRRGRTT